MKTIKNKLKALWVALAIAFALCLVGAPTAAMATECVPSPGVAAVEYQPAVYGEAPLISEAVYVIEYEFVHKHEDHPNSPRWEREGWNADSNPHSKGWYSTGNTREVLISEAVYGEPPLISPEVLAQDAIPPVVCPPPVTDPEPEPEEPPVVPPVIDEPAPPVAALAAPIDAEPVVNTLAETGTREEQHKRLMLIAGIASALILGGAATLATRRPRITE